LRGFENKALFLTKKSETWGENSDEKKKTDANSCVGGGAPRSAKITSDLKAIAGTRKHRRKRLENGKKIGETPA